MKSRDFWFILKDNDTAQIATEALIYFSEPTQGAIKGLSLHVREVIPFDWDKFWSDMNKYRDDDSDTTDYHSKIQQLVEKQLRGE